MFTFYKQRVLMTLQSVEATSILKWAIVVKGAFSKLNVLSYSLPLSLFDLLHATWWKGYDFFAPFGRSLCFLLQPFFVQLHFWVLFFLRCWSFLFVPLVPLLDWCLFFNKVWQWLIIANYYFHFWVNGMVITFKIIDFNMAWGIGGLGVFTNWIDGF